MVSKTIYNRGDLTILELNQLKTIFWYAYVFFDIPYKKNVIEKQYNIKKHENEIRQLCFLVALELYEIRPILALARYAKVNNATMHYYRKKTSFLLTYDKSYKEQYYPYLEQIISVFNKTNNEHINLNNWVCSLREYTK